MGANAGRSAIGVSPPRFDSLLRHQQILEMLPPEIREVVRQRVEAESKYKGEPCDVTGGVAEIWPSSGQVDGALETDRGRVVFTGKVLHRASPDVQSGAEADWRRFADIASQRIRTAYETLPAVEALTEIGAIWEELDRCAELAAARSRLLLGKLDPPRLCETPTWFILQKGAVLQAAQEDGDIGPRPEAFDSAELLVRAAIASLDPPEGISAELDVGPLGRLVVDWDVPHGRLRWMVDIAELSWPAVKVFQLRRLGPGLFDVPAETKILYNAFDVVEQFHRHVCEQ